MSIYKQPIVFAIVAFAIILVGTLVTTFIPLFTPGMSPKEPWVKPYTALELEGRDIYIREGCNNCHTQTVRPLKFEVTRYGDYSKGAESSYDRPFLWGSRRTGPDLARVGGKYPDSWHYQHMKDPQSMFAQSNMPAYAWLSERKLNTAYTEKKMKTLGFPYSSADIRALDGKTEMDAMVAYLQKLGRDLKEAQKAKGGPVAEAVMAEKNPFEGKPDMISAGKEIFEKNCAICHGKDGKGGIGPNLVDTTWIYGSSDGEIFASIFSGRAGGMPPFDQQIGKENTWKVVIYLRSIAEKQS